MTISPTKFLTLPDGRIAYDVRGEGALVLLVPGMGELRSSYRHLVPYLVAAGYRVATMDLRGHGDSDASFASYGDADTASDITRLVRTLGSRAVIVGNSMAAGAAAIVAAEDPELVDGLVLIGPFVRPPESSTRFEQLLFRVLMARPWVTAAWNAYVPRLYAGRRPSDFADYRCAMVAAMKRPGYARAFALTTRTDHGRAGASLGSVTTPALVVMGAKDPDFKDPQAEARWIGWALSGTVVMIDDAGHYPQSQQPEVTAAAMIRFLSTVAADA